MSPVTVVSLTFSLERSSHERINWLADDHTSRPISQAYGSQYLYLISLKIIPLHRLTAPDAGSDKAACIPFARAI